MTLSKTLTAVASLFVVACGGADISVSENPKADTDEPLVYDDDERSGGHRARTPGMNDDDDDDDGVSIEGLKGTLSTYDIAKGIKPHSTALAMCFQQESKRNAYLGGDIELSFTIATDGSVKSVHASQSSVGSWAVEQCLLSVGKEMEFRQPKGGEADFTIPLEFDSRRSTQWWAEERADKELGAKPSELAECSKNAPDPSNVWVTLYLGNRGLVTSAGFATPDAQGVDPAWADCAAAKIQSWTLSDPRGKIAKLGFRYNPE